MSHTPSALAITALLMMVFSPRGSNTHVAGVLAMIASAGLEIIMP